MIVGFCCCCYLHRLRIHVVPVPASASLVIVVAVGAVVVDHGCSNIEALHGRLIGALFILVGPNDKEKISKL